VRRRILVATATVAFVAIAVLGLPLAVVARGMVRQDALRRLDREADAVSVAIDDDVERHAAVEPARIATVVRPRRQVVVTDPDGRRTVVGSALTGTTSTPSSAPPMCGYMPWRWPSRSLSLQKPCAVLRRSTRNRSRSSAGPGS